jgi:3',5'-cyclic-AMP phosphodiesterase
MPGRMMQFTRAGRRRAYPCMPMSTTDLHLLQFTDLHLLGDAGGKLRGVATLPALRAVLAHARAKLAWPVDAILATGDLVQDDPRGYAAFRHVFEQLHTPVYCLPGNHDDVEAMARELREQPFVVGGAVDRGCWRIVLLDTSVPGRASGHLGPGALAGLESALGTADDRHVLVCMHHHPVPMGSAWLDRLSLDNAEQFFRVIDGHSNVRAILWGHVHQQYEGLRRGVRLLGTPATCTQFLPRAAEFALDTRPGAYRTLDLRPDGSLLTEVVWVPACAAGSQSSVSSAA